MCRTILLRKRSLLSVCLFLTGTDFFLFITLDQVEFVTHTDLAAPNHGTIEGRFATKLQHDFPQRRRQLSVQSICPNDVATRAAGCTLRFELVRTKGVSPLSTKCFPAGFCGQAIDFRRRSRLVILLRCNNSLVR